MKRTGRKVRARIGKNAPSKKNEGEKNLETLGTSLVFLALGFAGIGELVLKVGEAWKKSKSKKKAELPQEPKHPSAPSIPAWDELISGKGKQEGS